MDFFDVGIVLCWLNHIKFIKKTPKKKISYHRTSIFPLLYFTEALIPEFLHQNLTHKVPLSHEFNFPKEGK